jgi:hypothetical protein
MGVEVNKLVPVSGSDKNQISRRDFIKGTAAAIDGPIGALIGIQSVGYLLSPSLQAEEDNDSIEPGPLENYSIGGPTRFDFTRTRVNG